METHATPLRHTKTQTHTYTPKHRQTHWEGHTNVGRGRLYRDSSMHKPQQIYKAQADISRLRNAHAETKALTDTHKQKDTNRDICNKYQETCSYGQEKKPYNEHTDKAKCNQETDRHTDRHG